MNKILIKNLQHTLAFTLLLAACSDSAEEEAAPCEVLRQVQARSGANIFNPTPGVSTLASYIIQDGRVRAGVPSTCSDAVAQRLQESACPVCDGSPGQCEPLVRAIFDRLPPECATCGDGECLASAESALTCPIDCATPCGDGLCETAGGESAETCPIDCATPCGDGLCLGAETPETCPDDCNFSIGDGICAPGENALNSPNDCGGDVIGLPCESDAECRGKVCINNACTCRLDDAAEGEQVGVCSYSTCGDGYCQSYENAFACQEDCCDQLACQVGDTFCADDFTVATCEIGEGNCPTQLLGASCAFGCVDGACSPCPLLPGLIPCAGPGNGTCDREDRSTAIVCHPLPGFPGCNVETRVRCPEDRCQDGAGCFACQGGCTTEELGAVRCAEDGSTLERCDLAGGACPTWLPQEICPDTLRCDAAPTLRPPRCL